MQAATPVEYRPIPGYPAYRAGNDGSIWSSKYGEWRIMKQSKNNKGYHMVGLYEGLAYKRFLVHRLVALAFLGPPPTEGMQACHNDGRPSNCRLDNIRWDTPKGNQADRIQHGTAQYGEANPICALTDDAVRTIIAALASGRTHVEIAKEHGVIRETIGHIALRKTWRHVWDAYEAEHGPVPKLRRRHLLNDEIVREIIAALQQGDRCQAVADRHGLNYSLVYQISKKKSWKHVWREIDSTSVA